MTDTFHTILILDESGSMEEIKRDMIDGVNKLIHSQKAEAPDSVFTLLKFNCVLTYVMTRKPIAEVKELTTNDYNPAETTALYDAVGECITRFTEDKRVCLVIVTDGMENQSQKFSQTVVKDLISKKTTEGWNVLYLSADLNTFKQGENMGIQSTPRGMRTASNNVVLGYGKLGRGVAQAASAISQCYNSGDMDSMGNGK